MESHLNCPKCADTKTKLTEADQKYYCDKCKTKFWWEQSLSEWLPCVVYYAIHYGEVIEYFISDFTR